MINLNKIAIAILPLCNLISKLLRGRNAANLKANSSCTLVSPQAFRFMREISC